MLQDFRQNGQDLNWRVVAAIILVSTLEYIWEPQWPSSMHLGKSMLVASFILLIQAIPHHADQAQTTTHVCVMSFFFFFLKSLCTSQLS